MRRFIRSWINWRRQMSKGKKGEVLDSGMREYLEKYEEIIRIKKTGTEMSIGLARYVKMPQI